MDPLFDLDGLNDLLAPRRWPMTARAWLRGPALDALDRVGTTRLSMSYSGSGGVGRIDDVDHDGHPPADLLNHIERQLLDYLDECQAFHDHGCQGTLILETDPRRATLDHGEPEFHRSEKVL